LVANAVKFVRPVCVEAGAASARDELDMTKISIAKSFDVFQWRSAKMAIAVVPALALGGCFEGTEVNGKIFDLLGVSSSSQEKSRAEPQMARRAGLVLPPNAQRLPAPGSEDEAAAIAPAVASLNDPEKVKANAAVERARLHKAYCSGDLSWKEQVKDPNALPKSPYGSCSAVGDLFKK
jgi:hypothetical protein